MRRSDEVQDATADELLSLWIARAKGPEGAYFVADLQRSGQHGCRLALMGTANSEDAARTARQGRQPCEAAVRVREGHEDRVVPRNEMIKGYELLFQLFQPDELKALDEGTSHVIDIVSFIPEKEVDPIYFDKVANNN